MNLGLSSQLEALWPGGGVCVGLSKVLWEMIVGGDDFSALFSVIMIVGFAKAGELVDGTGSILGGGTPVSRPQGVSSRLIAVDLALIGGTGFRGGGKAFSPDSGPGSPGLRVEGVVVAMTRLRWTS